MSTADAYKRNQDRVDDLLTQIMSRIEKTLVDIGKRKDGIEHQFEPDRLKAEPKDAK